MPGPERPPHLRNPLHTRAAQPATPPSTAAPAIRPDRGPITLAQFLKLRGVADHGGHAKALVREGQVHVNGQAEIRPGRKLAKGDRVVVAGGDELIVDR